MAEMLTREELAAIRKRCEHIILGPWDSDGVCVYAPDGKIVADCDQEGAMLPDTPDFIAHARGYIPRLLDHINTLEDHVRWLLRCIYWLEGSARIEEEYGPHGGYYITRVDDGDLSLVAEAAEELRKLLEGENEQRDE